MIIQSILTIAGFVVRGLSRRDRSAEGPLPCAEAEYDAVYRKALCREQELAGCHRRDPHVDEFYRYLVPDFPASPCQR